MFICSEEFCQESYFSQSQHNRLFPDNKNGEDLVFHGFKDCLLRRKDETVGQMIACDGCGLWFYHQCMDEKTDDQRKIPFPSFSQEGTW